MKQDLSERLARDGGPRAKRTPFGPRKRHGELEKVLLQEVIDSDTLFFYTGTKVSDFQTRFRALYGRRHCIACSSGTAAVHIALGALELPPGTEVITSAITDMGSLTGMLYQGLVPVFADVDPDTLNMDPGSVRSRITKRTGAILAVHHSGLAADLDGMLDISREFGIPLVEDCAQAYGCEYKGKLVGNFGVISAFSLNHFKHITCGSGGMIVTDEARLRYVASLFVDKCYQREEGIRNPFFLAPNYQMTELQGAVALAQLARLRDVVDTRNRLGSRLAELIADIPGVQQQRVPEGSRHSYFLFLFRLDLHQLGCKVEDFADALAAEGIPAKARTITGGMPVYQYDIFRNRTAFPGSVYPFASLDTGIDRQYRTGDCPTAEAAFDNWITMDLHEHFTDTDIDEIAFGIAKVANAFVRQSGYARSVTLVS